MTVPGGSLDSLERGAVEWNNGTVEWNSGMVERWISGMGNYDNDPVRYHTNLFDAAQLEQSQKGDREE